jgi:hypothetical protein
MGIDYMIGLPCEPKERLGSQGIISLLKAREHGKHVLGMMRHDGDERPAAEITFTTAVYRKDGGTEHKEVNVQELLDQGKPLDLYAAHCTGCPANIAGAPYGCNGYINYPVEEHSEAWLMSRLPDDLGSTAGWLLQEAARDFEWDGARAAAMRQDGDMFFEVETPVETAWGEGDHTFDFDSDQLFDILFSLGALQPAHMRMLALLLGILPHDLGEEAFGAAMRDPERLAGAFDLGTLEVNGEPSQVQQLALFLRAMCCAATLDVEMLIDS